MKLSFEIRERVEDGLCWSGRSSLIKQTKQDITILIFFITQCHHIATADLSLLAEFCCIYDIADAAGSKSLGAERACLQTLQIINL